MHSSYYGMTVFSATTQMQLLCSLGSHCSLCCCAPITLQIHVLVRAELPWEEEDAAALAQHCFISSAVLSAPDAQQPCATPAQGALHPSRGWQRAEEAGPSAPTLAAAVVVAKWAVEGIRGRDVCQAPTFHSNLQCHFSS